MRYEKHLRQTLTKIDRSVDETIDNIRFKGDFSNFTISYANTTPGNRLVNKRRWIRLLHSIPEDVLKDTTCSP